MRRLPVNRQGYLNINREAQGDVVSIPAPVGGLNARDALANMSPLDAVILENWWPGTSSVDVRKGSEDHVTGLPNNYVETLARYSSASTSKLFAVCDSEIYDVTTSGTAGAALVTGLTNSRFQKVNFTNAAGSWLYLVNGSDGPQLYNGTAWQTVTQVSSPIAITGVDPSTFINVNSYKNRLFFIPVNSTAFYYLAVNAVGGAATKFDLGPLLSLGGYLMAMVTWSMDNTSGGLQEFAAFISSEGEVIVYQGNDPDFVSSWFLVSKFRIGRPVGRRCWEKVGSDILIICADGLFPLSKALLTDRSRLNEAITDKIVNLINTDIASYGNNFGWQCVLYPTGQKIILNVPRVEGTNIYQYVMNTVTGAWTKFTGWTSSCWELFNDEIYFGAMGVVTKADTGQNDNDNTIIATAQPAFSYFGTQGQKIFTLTRPIFTTDGNLNAAIGLCINFGTTTILSTPTFSGSSGSPWNTSPWNVTPWGGVNNVVANWLSTRGVGFSATIKMIVYAKNITVSWQSTDYVWESGGVL